MSKERLPMTTTIEGTMCSTIAIPNRKTYTTEATHGFRIERVACDDVRKDAQLLRIASAVTLTYADIRESENRIDLALAQAEACLPASIRKGLWGSTWRQRMSESSPSAFILRKFVHAVCSACADFTADIEADTSLV